MSGAKSVLETITENNFIKELIAYLEPYIPEALRGIDTKKAIRLIVIVGGYVFIRNIAQKELARRQLARQVSADNEQKKQERIEDLVDDPNASGIDTKWGWGKSTRRHVKRQEKILEQQLEDLHAQTLEDDKDIEDLLED